MLCLYLLLLVSLYIPVSECHIHSQKVRNYTSKSVSVETWILSLISACLVGCCGIVPLFLNRWIKLDGIDGSSSAMQAVLSFAVGGLLGDVWLHLLPEAWGPKRGEDEVKIAGLWVIIGLISFMGVEKFAKAVSTTNEENVTIGNEKVATPTNNGHSNGHICSPLVTKETSKDISGYLNLIANCTDNFTHGLAISASYIVNPIVGLLTTAAIICHEIPHEIGDFAILLRSGFSANNAVRAQLLTATGGLVGVIVGLLAEQIGHCTSWMLPFTAGGFLYISLVSIIPELLEEKSSYGLQQIACVVSGIVVMAAVTIVEKKSCEAMPVIAS